MLAAALCLIPVTAGAQSLQGQWNVTVPHNPAYLGNALIDAQGRVTYDSPRDNGAPKSIFGYVAHADGMALKLSLTDRIIVIHMNCAIMSSDLLHCVSAFHDGTKSSPFILTRVGPGPQKLARSASK